MSSLIYIYITEIKCFMIKTMKKVILKIKYKIIRIIVPINYGIYK